MKRKSTVYAAFVLLLSLLAVCMAMPASAASKKSQAVSAYRAYLETQGENALFDLIYLNKDSVPELTVNKEIYTFKNGSMVKLESSLLLMYWPSTYYKKKGVMTLGYAHGGYFPSQFVRYVKMSGKKLISKMEIGKYGETNMSTGKVKWTTSYSVQKGGTAKTVKKAAFNKALKKLVGTKKATKIKQLQNTEANRAKYLK